jgi:hypothetical protein
MDPTDACFEQFGQNKITCECRTTILGSAVQDCFQTLCKPKEVFTVLNAISTSCNEPVRDKATSYRMLSIVFFTLASLSVLARFTTHLSVGRSSIFENANIALGYVRVASHTSQIMLTVLSATKCRTLRMLHTDVLPGTWPGHVESG